MRYYDDQASAVASVPRVCERRGCTQNRPCRIEIMVERVNGERAPLLRNECDWSSPGLCTACDQRLLPELESLFDVWRQLGAMTMAYRGA